MIKEDEAKIKAVLERLVNGWRTADAKLLQGAWDPEYPDSSLIVPESPGPLFGQQAIKQYYDMIAANFPDVEVEIKDLKITELDGLGHVFCNMVTRVTLPDYGSVPRAFEAKDFMVRGRLTLVLRKRRDEWYIVHYHESTPWEPLPWASQRTVMSFD